MTDDTFRATPAVWRKRIFQVPAVGFNPHNWTLGFSWTPADENGGDLVLSFGPVGLIWDAWP